MLRSKFNLVLALTAVIALSGCYEIEKIFNQGTVKGVSLCMENDSSPLLSDELIKRSCIKEHQTTFSGISFSGRAYVNFNLEKDQVDVRISEGSSGYDNIIITEIHVLAYIYDENGKKYSNNGIMYVWLEPNVELTGSRVLIKDFGLPEGVSFDEALRTFCSDVEKKVSCRSWELSHFRGLKI